MTHGDEVFALIAPDADAGFLAIALDFQPKANNASRRHCALREAVDFIVGIVPEVRHNFTLSRFHTFSLYSLMVRSLVKIQLRAVFTMAFLIHFSRSL